MKTTRRSFFGLMGGAAAAGPKLASTLTGDALASPSILSGGGGAGGMIIGSNKSWELSRIADLRKWLTGGHPEDKHERRRTFLYQLETRERFRLDSLRSVAPTHKVAMLTEGNYERQQRLRQMEWERELANLTGGIL